MNEEEIRVMNMEIRQLIDQASRNDDELASKISLIVLTHFQNSEAMAPVRRAMELLR